MRPAAGAATLATRAPASERRGGFRMRQARRARFATKRIRVLNEATSRGGVADPRRRFARAKRGRAVSAIRSRHRRRSRGKSRDAESFGRRGAGRRRRSLYRAAWIVMPRFGQEKCVGVAEEIDDVAAWTAPARSRRSARTEKAMTRMVVTARISPGERWPRRGNREENSAVSIVEGRRSQAAP